jgi:pimeloyl-ACP methyl ester carboxylesterase
MTYFAHFEKREKTAPVDILFVHGNLASKYWWYPALELLEQTFKSTTTNLYGSMYMGELRGCGRSPLPTEGKVEINDIVNDFISYTEAQNLKNVCVVGHSAGGLITALLLARRPDLFKGAILVDPVGTRGLQNVPADIADRYKMMEANSDMAAQIVSATVYQNNPENELFKTKIMPDVMSSLKTAGVQLVNALMGVDYTQEIQSIQQPVRVFYGAHDWVLDATNAKSYSENIKNCTHIDLPDNGHCMNYENPERMASEVVSFIKENFK